MHFSVIYSVDVPANQSIKSYLPTQRHLFQQTEGDDQYEYEYLRGCWSKGKHRKLCAILTKKQFQRFLDDTGIYAEDVETMGSLGAPGCGYGLSPAISFRGDDPESIQSAYVTPLPDVTPQRQVTEERGERFWGLIRRAVLRMYHPHYTKPLFGQ